MEGKRSGGTGIQTASAADTFGAVWLLRWINVKGTGVFAFAAADTFLLLQLISSQRDRIKAAVHCAERTQIPAERTVEKYGEQQDSDQQCQLPVP